MNRGSKALTGLVVTLVVMTGAGGNSTPAKPVTGLCVQIQVVACQNSCRASDLDFYPQRSCSFASSISS